MRLPLPLLAATVLGAAAPGLPAQETIGKKRRLIPIEWAERETANYAIRYESSRRGTPPIPASTVDRIGRELEEILEQYVRIFGERRGKDHEKFRVKFLDSLNTYEQEGGDPSHPGKYLGGTRTLVIRQMAFYDLIPTLYHEAFHQYLHFYVGDGVGIPIWFNEGMAVYYEGIQRNRGDKKLNPKRTDNRRLRMVKDKIATRQEIPLEKLIDAGGEEFHDKDKESLSYAQSFALAYFLMEKTGGRAVLRFARTLRDTKDVAAANVTLFGKDRKNLKRLEAEWKRFVLGVKLRGR